MMPGHDGRVEQIGEDHDYIPSERIDPPVAHSYPPLDARAQQLWDELLERLQLYANRRQRRVERERENHQSGKGKRQQEDN